LQGIGNPGTGLLTPLKAGYPCAVAFPIASLLPGSIPRQQARAPGGQRHKFSSNTEEVQARFCPILLSIYLKIRQIQYITIFTPRRSRQELKKNNGNCNFFCVNLN
jgi:hypothetical protein